jgi:hypothetical protein
MKAPLIGGPKSRIKVHLFIWYADSSEPEFPLHLASPIRTIDQIYDIGSLKILN